MVKLFMIKLLRIFHQKIKSLLYNKALAIRGGCIRITHSKKNVSIDRFGGPLTKSMVEKIDPF